MNRRDLLKQIAVLTGGAVLGAEFFLTGCKAKANPAQLTAEQLALLDEVGETIIPTTDSPGAKAAKIGAFMKTIVSDCYTQQQQDAFMAGIDTLESACKKMHGAGFVQCTPKQRHEFLISLEKEAKPFNEKIKKEEDELKEKAKAKEDKVNFGTAVTFNELPRHYYTMMKQLTIWGYFTSKEGMTMALRYNPVPGKYDGAAPYKQGEKAWATD